MRPYSIHPYIRIFIIVHITTFYVVMAGKKGDNTKKAAGNAKVRFSVSEPTTQLKADDLSSRKLK